jgi:small-conductance mechanosensitive channel
MRPDAGGIVYGTIVVATLLAAESAQGETYAKTIGAVVLAMLTYWLAVSYAHYSGERIERQQRFEYEGLARTAISEVTMLIGAVPELLAVLIVWALGDSLEQAIRVGVIVAALTIVVTEFVTGLRADLRGRELVRQTLVGAVFGVLIIVLRLLLH